MFTQYKKHNFKRILLIRSSAKLFPLVLEEVKKIWPLADITVLATQGVDTSAVAGLFNEKMELPDVGGFSASHSGWVRSVFSQKSFDLAVVLYNSQQGYSYSNIDACALASGARHVVSVNINKEVGEVTAHTLLMKRFHQIFDKVWSVINVVLLCIVLGGVICGMVITLPIIFLRRFINK